MHTEGFTLLEVLIAISIFAVLSLTAYFSLANAIKQKQIGESQANDLRRIQVSLMHLERDLQQAVNRVSSNGLTREPAFEYSSIEAPRLRFIRTGWSNPLGRPRANLQRVGYLFKDQQLYRLTWPQLDALQGEEPQQAGLLVNMESWQLRLLDSKGKWHESWPQKDASGVAIEPLPLAVELKLNIVGWGEMRRLVRLAGS